MIKDNYSKRYQNDKVVHVYPVEFVVRAFLGTYPNLKMPKNDYQGKQILDLGYGDGRNMPLLKNMGMKISGVEITEEINVHVHDRMNALGIETDLRLGSNSNIPFDSAFFDYVLACHSCYYIEEGQNFTDNLKEIARVTKPDGIFIASIPMADTYILQDSTPVSEGHYRITHDPYGIRNGVILRAFKTSIEVETAFSEHFSEISVGFCDDLFWGIHQKVWTVVCRRKSN